MATVIVGDTLTFTFEVSFKSAFVGEHSVYAAAWNRETISQGWEKMADLTVNTPTFDLVGPAANPVVETGGLIGVTVNLVKMYGFNSAVVLSASVPNQQLAASFPQNPVSGPFTMYVNAAGATPGVHQVNVSGSGGGVSDAVTILVQVNAPPLVAWCSVSNAAPYVSQPVTFTGSASGGVPPYTFTWSGTVNVPTHQNPVSFMPADSITYPQSVLVRDSQGATASGQCPVTVRTLANLAELRACVKDAPTGGKCRLNAGQYTVSEPIHIQRSTVTVAGSGPSMSDTRLVRAASYEEELIRIGPALSGGTAVHGVTFQNLTVCGGSNIRVGGTASPVGCPRMETACGAKTLLATNDPEMPGLPPQCVDVSVWNAALPSPPTSPFTSPPSTYAVEFDRVDLEDATGHALQIQGYPDWRADDVFFHHGAINYSGVTGILVGAVEVSYPRKQCDANPNFADARDVFLARNIRVEDSTFTENNTGVVGGGARWFAMRRNQFYRNYIWPQAQGGSQPNPIEGGRPIGDPNQSAGGTLEFDACSDQVLIFDNTFVGPGTAHERTEALELYGRNITVRGNRISGYQAEGIVANSLFNAKIENNTITFSNPMTPAGGISLATLSAREPCKYAPSDAKAKPLETFRETNSVSISGNVVSGQQFGVHLADHPVYGTGALNNLTICQGYSGTLCGFGGNSLTAPVPIGRDAFTWANAQNGYYGPVATFNGHRSPTPRALPVETEPNSLLGLCHPQGATSAKLTFAATDDSDGASNAGDPRLPGSSYSDPIYTGGKQVLSIQAIFSGKKPDDGGPTNTASDCMFLWMETDPVAEPLGRVYLDDGNGKWEAGWSKLGPGGTDLTNPTGCTIHAATSYSSAPKPGEYVRSVTLDIEFHGPAWTKYVYVVTTNKNLVSSGANGGQSSAWRYWGWWKKP